MAEDSKRLYQHDSANSVHRDEKLREIRERLVCIRKRSVSWGVSAEKMRAIVLVPPPPLRAARHSKSHVKRAPLSSLASSIGNVCMGLGWLALLTSVLFHRKNFVSSRCALSTNYIVMEMSRPIADCAFCRNVTSVLVLHNVTKEVFAKLAYSGRPVLVKGATTHWSALHVFTFDYFKQLYERIEGAYDSVEEECQFFPFQTDFLSLKEVFNMRQNRAEMASHDEEPWYIGWSNCHPDVAEALRHHYSAPAFLPNESESSAIDWIFMGFSGQGASMHLDYVQRPSWQAQISGTKTWQLLPPPECEGLCQAMNITVQKGDIILIDTNQWYHDTTIHPGEISITIGSEYD